MSEQTPPPTPPSEEEIAAAAAALAAREQARRERAEAERARLVAEADRRRARDEQRGPARGKERRAPSDLTDLTERAQRLRAQYASPTDGGPLDRSDEPHDETPEQTIARQRAEKRREAWEASLKRARIGDRLARTTMADLHPTQEPASLRYWVDNLRDPDGGRHLVLHGRVGSGKTAAAIAVGSYAAEQGLMVRIVRHSHYLNWLTPSGADPEQPEWQIRSRTRDADLLIVDDLAAGLERGVPASPFVQKETLNLIGDRIESGKATVFTTNWPDDELEKMLGERAISRMCERGAWIEVNHPDRRRDPAMKWGRRRDGQAR